ncbi:hypothetical protein [Desulfosarcina variabilis]|uniref:hypothetical protein n=1 Tax=Desulfosarcina variabilis TaxID=2300 RepID=UPI003AFB46F7
MNTTQEIVAECTTKETGIDGVRHGCDSAITRITAADGHVFAEKTLKGGETSGSGSEHDCRLGWDDYVEVIPNTEIKQPRTITLQAHARSPKGHSSGRGWAKCKYTVEVAKYK